MKQKYLKDLAFGDVVVFIKEFLQATTECSLDYTQS